MEGRWCSEQSPLTRFLSVDPPGAALVACPRLLFLSKILSVVPKAPVTCGLWGDVLRMSSAVHNFPEHKSARSLLVVTRSGDPKAGDIACFVKVAVDRLEPRTQLNAMFTSPFERQGLDQRLLLTDSLFQA